MSVTIGRPSSFEVEGLNYKYYPCQEEWDRVEEISKFLEIFYKVTCIFLELNTIQQIYMFFQSIHDLANIGQSYVGLKWLYIMAGRVYSKFEKYWFEYSIILGYLHS